MAERIPQSATIRVPLQAYLASDHVSPATGKTIAVTISKNGGAYANPSGGATNATEIGSGSYYVDLSTTDAGTAGPLFVKGAEGTIDTIIAIYNVVNANNGGLAALPDAAADAAGGLPISDAGGFDVDALSLHVDELWKLHGLDMANPLTVSESARAAGAINQTITGAATKTVTRV